MIDQATELRKLVLRAMRESPAAIGPPPRLVAMVGGKSEVGVTTIAVNLSVALADLGARLVVVDANLDGPNIATRCGLTSELNLADVLSAKRDIHEVLLRGPSGIQIVPGMTPQTSLQEEQPMALARLQRQLASLGRHADIVVLDLGSRGGELARFVCAAAADVLVVTSPDNSAVMETYACIKRDLPADGDLPVHLIVNLVHSGDEANDVYGRIALSCEKFLNRTIQQAPFVPWDESVTEAASQPVPLLLSSSRSPATNALQRLATSLWKSGQPQTHAA